MKKSIKNNTSCIIMKPLSSLTCNKDQYPIINNFNVYTNTFKLFKKSFCKNFTEKYLIKWPSFPTICYTP